MDAIDILQEGLEFARCYGWVGGVSYLLETLSQRVTRMERAENFDAAFATDTGTVIYPWNLPSVRYDRNPQIHGYEGVSAETIRELLASIPLPPNKFVFADLGSGKGRALLVASEFPFAKIVGVELATELHQIAEENVRRYRPQSQQCSTFSLHCMDAAAYEFGPEPVLLFMYNPFGKETVRSVLKNLEASLRATPREALVVYLNPRFQSVLRKAPFLRKVKAGGGRWRPWAQYVVYRAVT